MRTRILGGILTLVIGCCAFAFSAHAVGPIVSITISPTESTLAAGTTQSFTVTGQDAVGSTTDLTANSVFTTTDPLGTVSANVYTAGKSGSWVVTGTYNNLSADAEVAVTPSAVNEIVINPNSEPERLTVGASRSFTAEAFDVFNNVISDAEVQWTVTGDIGTVKTLTATTAKLTATDAGDGTLVARIGEKTASIDVSVTAATSTNTNENANTNTATTNTNAATNTNANTNAATNSDDGNANTNRAITTTDTTNTNTATTESESCNGWSRTTWILFFVAYVVLLVGGLYPIRKSRPSWWWAIPLVLTVAIIWIYYQFRCYPVFPAYPYLALLAAITVISWFNWQQPQAPVIPPAQPRQ